MSKTDKDRIEAAIEYAKDSGVITGEEMVEAWPGASDAMAECPRCTSHVVGRKGDEYYYWMFQCCLLVILAGLGVWVNYVFNGLSIQSIINDVAVPVVWTWLAIFLFDIFR
jgi:hypothetical protein